MKRKTYYKPRHIKNERIRAREVRVITFDGKNLGVLKTSEALQKAREDGYDLLLVVPNANPPVAKIVDFNKFLYDERKKQSSGKAKSKKIDLKEFRMGPTTGGGDIQRFINRGKKFLEEGNKVKITVKMRGRQRIHPEVAFEKLKIFEKEFASIAKVEMPPKKVGNMVRAIFAPK